MNLFGVICSCMLHRQEQLAFFCLNTFCKFFCFSTMDFVVLPVSLSTNRAKNPCQKNQGTERGQLPLHPATECKFKHSKEELWLIFLAR